MHWTPMGSVPMDDDDDYDDCHKSCHMFFSYTMLTRHLMNKLFTLLSLGFEWSSITISIIQLWLWQLEFSQLNEYCIVLSEPEEKTFRSNSSSW